MKEELEELYKGVDNSHDYKEEEPQSEDDMGPDFLPDFLAAIGEIKNNKAEGIDNISIPRGLGGVVVIVAAIGAHGKSRPRFKPGTLLHRCSDLGQVVNLSLSVA